MPVTINVTEEDIREGIPGNCFSCPAALAMERRFGAASGANVYASSEGPLRVEVWGLSVPAPLALREFVDTFDALARDGRGFPILVDAQKLKPFTFELPDESDPVWSE